MSFLSSLLGKYAMIALGLGGGTASAVAGMLSPYKSTEVVVSEADTKDVGAQTPTEQEDKGDSVSGFESPQDATTSEEGATSESVSEEDGVTAQQPSLGQEMGVQDTDLDVEAIKSTTADSETGDNADGKVNQADSDELGTPSLQQYADLQVQGTPTNAEGGETSDIPLRDKKDSEGPKVDPTTKQIAEPKSNVKTVSAQEPVSSVPVSSTPQITTISPSESSKKGSFTMKSGNYENLEDNEFEAQECDIKENGGQVFFTCPWTFSRQHTEINFSFNPSEHSGLKGKNWKELKELSISPKLENIMVGFVFYGDESNEIEIPLPLPQELLKSY